MDRGIIICGRGIRKSHLKQICFKQGITPNKKSCAYRLMGTEFECTVPFAYEYLIVFMENASLP
jgi:hypothetical protein